MRASTLLDTGLRATQLKSLGYPLAACNALVDVDADDVLHARLPC